MKTQLYRELYVNLVSLASIAGIDETGLQKYFIPEGNTSPESILFRLCSSLQNSGMMRNSIKFNDADPAYRNAIKNVLFDYDMVAYRHSAEAKSPPKLSALCLMRK